MQWTIPIPPCVRGLRKSKSITHTKSTNFHVFSCNAWHPGGLPWLLASRPKPRVGNQEPCPVKSGSATLYISHYFWKNHTRWDLKFAASKLCQLFGNVEKSHLKLACLPSVVKLNLDREDGEARWASPKNQQNSNWGDRRLWMLCKGQCYKYQYSNGVLNCSVVTAIVLGPPWLIIYAHIDLRRETPSSK